MFLLRQFKHRWLPASYSPGEPPLWLPQLVSGVGREVGSVGGATYYGPGMTDAKAYRWHWRVRSWRLVWDGSVTVGGNTAGGLDEVLVSRAASEHDLPHTVGWYSTSAQIGHEMFQQGGLIYPVIQISFDVGGYAVVWAGGPSVSWHNFTGTIEGSPFPLFLRPAVLVELDSVDTGTLTITPHEYWSWNRNEFDGAPCFDTGDGHLLVGGV